MIWEHDLGTFCTILKMEAFSEKNVSEDGEDIFSMWNKVLLHDKTGISAGLNCYKVFSRAGNLLGNWARASSISEEIDEK